MAWTKEQRNEWQREYRKRTGYAASKKYQNSEKAKIAQKEWRESVEGQKSIKRAVVSRKKRINSDFDTFVSYTFTSLKNGAKTRKLSFPISKPQLKKFLVDNPNCAETGRAVTYKQGCPNKASIDRIDNRYGYSIKNIRVVVQVINFARSDMTVDDFRQMCIDVAENVKKKQ
jgi:hypothetical protein